MEVLAGARDESHLEDLQGPLALASVLPTEPAHYDEAARLYRRCRREIETVRRLINCLIAAVAIGAGVPVLHRDDDFDVLARHTELHIRPVTDRARPGRLGVWTEGCLADGAPRGYGCGSDVTWSRLARQIVGPHSQLAVGCCP